MGSKQIPTECPNCGESYTIVVMESDNEQNTDQEDETDDPEAQMEAELLTWEETDPSSPYTGRDETVPVEQRVKCRIKVDGETYGFVIWYTPEHRHYRYVVKGELNDGPKMKNTYIDSDNNYIFYTPRGVPRDSDKQWTYLDDEECRRRAEIAGLGEIKSGESRPRVLIGEPVQPLVKDGEVAEELILRLSKGLVAFQTAQY